MKKLASILFELLRGPRCFLLACLVFASLPGVAFALPGGKSVTSQAFLKRNGSNPMTGTLTMVGFATTAGTIAADDTTPDVSANSMLVTSANTGATAITDLDNPTVDQIVWICGGSDTNSSTIADSGNFSLNSAMTLSLDVCIALTVQADNDYVELSRTNAGGAHPSDTDLVLDSGVHVIFGVDSDATTPSLTLEPGTGFYASTGGTIRVALDTAVQYTFLTTGFVTVQASGAYMLNEVASATNPVWSFFSDTDTGGTRVGADEYGIAAGGALVASFAQNDAAEDVTTLNSQLRMTGGDPVLSACGTTPAVVGNDSAGKVTIGTGTITSCTATFASAFAAAPACIVIGDNNGIGYAATTTTAVLTITSSADMATDVVNYVCIGL